MEQPCFYCENGEKLAGLMIPIIELEQTVIYLNRDQKHRGRCIVRLKEHLTEYHQMGPERGAVFFRELCLAARAIENLFHPDKLNYATFGDLVPHVHIHLVPKYRDGLHWGPPSGTMCPRFSWGPMSTTSWWAPCGTRLPGWPEKMTNRKNPPTQTSWGIFQSVKEPPFQAQQK